MSDVPMRTPSWEIRREIGVGHFRTYAHGYWRNPFVVVLLGQVLIGKRALRRNWERYYANILLDTTQAVTQDDEAAHPTEGTL